MDLTIRMVVRMLMARDNVTYDELAERTGIPRSTLTRRLGGHGDKGWSAAEIARLGLMFGVPAGEFYDPSGALFGGLRKAPFSIPTPRTAA